MATLKNTTVSDTGFLQLPVGTTAQRPTPAAGQMRFNTSTGKAEFYNDSVSDWVGTPAAGVVATGGTVYDVDAEGTTYRVHVFTSTGNSTFTVTKSGEVEYLIVAGGGGGGSDRAGGGGAGGVLTGTTTVTPQNYTITVGAGGQGGQGDQVNGSNGGNSSAFGLTAIGGGFGSYQTQTAGTGGSGGGGGGTDNGGSGAGGSGTPGQGNNGGSGNIGGNTTGTTGASGGGGGAGGVGRNGVAGTKAGDGGAGIISFLPGFSVYYAGGGGGGVDTRGTGDNVGLGGLGGGGTGGSRSPNSGGNIFPLAGTLNTGGGGGGGGLDPINGDPAFYGQSGGSGIVIVRYPLRQENPTVLQNSPIEDSLVLDFDFSKSTSYTGSGTRVSDSRLNGYTGTLINNPVPTNVRTHRGSFDFNAVDDYIEISHDEKLSQEIFSDRKIATLESWVRAEQFQNWTTMINKASGGSYSNTTGVGLWSNIDGYQFVIGQGVGGNPGNSSRVLSFTANVNQWYHIVGTVDGTTARLYANGVEITTDNTTINTVQTNTSPIVIGRRAPGSGPSFIGQIATARIYNRALSASEVLQQFNATRWRFGV